MLINITTIALIGDSLTAGYRNHPTYAQNLKLDNTKFRIGTFAKGGTTVIEGGDMSFWNFPAYKNSIKFKPDIIVVTFGLNALLKSNRKMLNTRFVSDFVRLIRSYNCKYSIICTPLPVTKNIWGLYDSDVRQYILPLYKNIALKTNSTIIDFHEKLNTTSVALTFDGVHPNIYATRIMAREVENIIKSLSHIH